MIGMSATTETYDFNFCFPVPRSLDSERLKLVPLIPSKHAAMLFEQFLIYPEIFTYLPFGPFKDFDEFKEAMLDGRFIKEHGLILFVVYDKTKPPSDEDHPGAVAGVIGLLNSSPANLVTEIGAVMILPPFQRTHVTSNAVGLLLQYCLNLPLQAQDRVGEVSAESGLGLRRVVWQANALNKASVRTAERMGFRMEGILRWDRVLPANKDASIVGNGGKTRDRDPRNGCVGRDTAMLSFCWDDWEEGGRGKVIAIMNRTA